MTPARRRLALCVLAGALASSACRSGDDGAPSDTGTVVAPASGSNADASSGVDAVAGNDESAADDTSVTGTVSSDASTPGQGAQTPLATTTPPPPSPPPSVVEVDPDELVLSDAFDDAERDDAWDDETWTVDAPGESSVAALDGVGVMETDLRGTHEWVRATAPGSSHEDASLLARITPIRSSEGTVFVGLHGDGEWRDASPYLPQSGVVVEYAYSEIFGGEVVLIVLDGLDERRIGPAAGPVLADGESANIRLEVVGRQARVKVWRDRTSEPTEWNIQADVPATDGGTVQISYRDGVGQSVGWDELSLLLLP